jgi:hypothetical protein
MGMVLALTESAPACATEMSDKKAAARRMSIAGRRREISFKIGSTIIVDGGD